MRLVKGLTTFVLIAALTALSAQAAQAAGPNGNDFTDPAQTGCSNTAVTVWSKNLIHPVTGVVNGRMELRYSTACQTNWVRINNYVNGATAEKILVRQREYLPEGGTVPYAEDHTSDTFYGWSYGLQLYAPAWMCVQVGGVIRLNGAVIASNGQALDRVC